MTQQEALEKAATFHATAQRALAHHGLAMTAFRVACARHDWELAAKEHQQAVDNLDAYLTALMSTFRLAQEIGE